LRIKGLDGAGVVELIEDHHGGTYRAVYTVRFATTRATPKRELDLIRERLKWAERLHTGKAEGV
jgi:phage-related protein